MDDKVKIRCPAGKQVFREKVQMVRDGVQLNCPHCCKLLTLNRDTTTRIAECRLKLERAASDPEAVRIIRAEMERLEQKLREIGE